MKTTAIFRLISIFLFSSFLFSCSEEVIRPPLKVGLVAGVGGLNDRGFNDMALAGVQKASGDLNFDWMVRESRNQTDIEKNLQYFCENHYDVVITLGYDAADLTLRAAVANPAVRFILVDFSLPNLLPNLACISFAIDQAAFPAGFLAAYIAQTQNPEAPMVGYVAGPQIPPIRQFTDSYTAGVVYFNTRYGRGVEVAGTFIPLFTDTLLGAKAAGKLIEQGARVVFACAGKTGNGALYQAKQSAIQAIGVDVDQYYTIPEVGDILLTSCMKRLDAAIEAELIALDGGRFSGGNHILANWSTGGVDLAPYHQLESLVPDSIRTAITQIKQGIMNGEIPTGWSE